MSNSLKAVCAVVCLFLTIVPLRSQADSWFMQACDRLLGLQPPPHPSQNLEHIQELLRNEARMASRFWSESFVTQIERVRELQGTPTTIVAQIRLQDGVAWIRPFTLKLIVNPQFLDADWDGNETNLAHSAAAMVIADDIPIKLEDGKSVPLTSLMQKEVERINEENPQLDEHLIIKKVTDFRPLKFTSEAQNKFVIWVDGNLRNFQVTRSLFLAMQEAAKHALKDSALARLPASASRQL